jgi:fermentation-respiration switch protein FrsA (DUF1100 family)
MPALRLVAYLATIYLTVGAFFYFEQSKLLFPAPKDYPNSSPRDAHLPFDDLQIAVGSGGHMHAWWIPHADAGDRTLLVFHGNGYVLEDMVADEIPQLHVLGANLLLVDYRGYGSSSALHPDENSVCEDARAALGFLLHDRRIPPREVFVLGRSIGSGPAVYLAQLNSALGGLILESPFSSVDDAASQILYLRLWPVPLMLRTHFDNYSRISAVRVPLFIAVGSGDTLTPSSMAQRIFARANEPKRILIVPGAGHNDLPETGGKSLELALRAYLSGSVNK